MFVIESAIAKAAEGLGVDAAVIQKKNLLQTGDEFPYGQTAISEANVCWDKASTAYDITTLRKEVKIFNENNEFNKKGIAIMPVCFGISFTNTMMNQGRALVHVFNDGSVSVTTGAIEMGQGVNTKILQVAANAFSLGADKIKLQSTSTHKIANTSPSAASATADLNGKATLMACNAIKERLLTVASEALNVDVSTIDLKDEYVCVNGERCEWTWKRLVMAAFLKRVSLSEHAHYSTPEIFFDKLQEKGHPFAYHVYGTAVITVTIDCIRGIYEFDSVKIIHDFGRSMNKSIDIGQIEGGVVQGIGWMTMEELMFDKEGKLRSNTLSSYKVPDIYSVPKKIEISALKTDKDNLAIFRSKAVGEPPLMYGIGAYFALRNAIKAFSPKTEISYTAPMTPERCLMALYAEKVSIQEIAEAKR
jgi:xanthine dehydrogenase large subunit